MIQTPQDATHLIGEALAAQADWVYLPSTCLSQAFFQLKSGLAGEVVQRGRQLWFISDRAEFEQKLKVRRGAAA